FIATGHSVVTRDGAVYRGADPRKDQSYFLWGIDRAVVARMLTPVGPLSKPETRAIAKRLGLVTAEKPESVEICFVPDGDYATVLERHLPEEAPALAPGPLVTVGATSSASTTASRATPSASAAGSPAASPSRCTSWRSAPRPARS